MAVAGKIHIFRATHFILGIILALGVSWNAGAQGTRVEGRVHDSSGAAIEGAKVQLSANSYSAERTTDTSGAFVFDGVPGASGTLAVTADGFQPIEQSWSAGAGATPQVNFALQPLTVSQRVVVTAARTSTPMGESPISTIQLTRHDLQQTPNLTLDDALRQVPGFSLFRRSSSRIANPTTMGVSLRGLGSGSGPSRVLVLEDGLPLNDPFGSWIYWDRVPNESVASVEVDEEGASSLYGSEAFAGVVQFLTRGPNPGGISLETSYGNQNTPDLSLWGGGEKGKWESTFSGDVFRTDGYILVPQDQRGSVDTKAGSEHGTADLMIGRKIWSDMTGGRMGLPTRRITYGSGRARWERTCIWARSGLLRCVFLAMRRPITKDFRPWRGIAILRFWSMPRQCRLRKWGDLRYGHAPWATGKRWWRDLTSTRRSATAMRFCFPD
jgi:hypothetical protein